MRPKEAGESFDLATMPPDARRFWLGCMAVPLAALLSGYVVMVFLHRPEPFLLFMPLLVGGAAVLIDRLIKRLGKVARVTLEGAVGLVAIGALAWTAGTDDLFTWRGLLAICGAMLGAIATTAFLDRQKWRLILSRESLVPEAPAQGVFPYLLLTTARHLERYEALTSGRPVLRSDEFLLDSPAQFPSVRTATGSKPSVFLAHGTLRIAGDRLRFESTPLLGGVRLENAPDLDFDLPAHALRAVREEDGGFGTFATMRVALPDGELEFLIALNPGAAPRGLDTVLLEDLTAVQRGKRPAQPENVERRSDPL